MRSRTIGLFLAAGLASMLVAAPGFTQDAARMQPHSYRVVFENDRVRVLEFTSRPGMGVCGSGVHSHPDHLSILLTPARVKVTQNGRTRIMNQPEGTVFWEPAVTHEVENYGGADVKAIIVEMKGPGSHR